ncbi:MAG: hypothetical protein ABN480_13960 [Dickeya sp.]
MLVNEYIKEFRKRSFFIENDLICDILVMFFRTSESGWISLSVNEGIAKILQESFEPFLLDVMDIDDEFFYPVKIVPELSDYIDKKIVNICEYRIKNVEHGCVGLYFDCGVTGFSLLEKEGCLSIFYGIYDGFGEEIYLRDAVFNKNS